MKYIYILLILIFLSGCAMTPDEPEPTGNQIIVEFKVAGKININERDDKNLLRNYFIALNCDNSDGTYGPLPVVYKSSTAYGWGNGWGTSDKATQSKGITSFLEYNMENSEGNLYNIIPESQLRQYSTPITPTSCSVTDDGKGIRAVFDFSQIETYELTSEDIKTIQINIITNNLIISNTTENTPGRRFDALGDTGNDYIHLDNIHSHTYTGKDAEGDVADEDLDITNWTVQIINKDDEK